MEQQTHFGFKTVEAAQKAGKVAEVFHSVANKYDVMNDFMSAGSGVVSAMLAYRVLADGLHHRACAFHDLAHGFAGFAGAHHTLRRLFLNG